MSLATLRTKLNSFADMNRTLSLTLMRMLGSAMFITHGWGKLFGERAQTLGSGMTSLNIGDVISIPTGINLLFVAGVVEIVGGALLVVGLFTRPLALLAAVQMLFAYLIAHLAWFPTLNRGEAATLYFLLYFVVFAYGPGPLSLDAMLRKR